MSIITYLSHTHPEPDNGILLPPLSFSLKSKEEIPTTTKPTTPNPKPQTPPLHLVPVKPERNVKRAGARGSHKKEQNKEQEEEEEEVQEDGRQYQTDPTPSARHDQRIHVVWSGYLTNLTKLTFIHRVIRDNGETPKRKTSLPSFRHTNEMPRPEALASLVQHFSVSRPSYLVSHYIFLTDFFGFFSPGNLFSPPSCITFGVWVVGQLGRVGTR